jgi:multicomponent Na+:H+ antiporter subunit E
MQARTFREEDEMVAARTRASQTPRRWQRLAWGAEVFAGLFLIWLALNGSTDWVLGMGFSALGAVIGTALAPGEPSRWRPWQVLSFAVFFLRESLRGGLDVARRALHPGLPVQPHFVDHALRLPAGPPRTLMVGLVGLLPGSMCADLDLTRNVMRVHLLSEDAGGGLDELESRIAALFGLELT